MSRLAVTILFALCISQYANAAAVSSTIPDVQKLKSEAETALKVIKFYTEQYLYELVEAQDNAKNDFKTGLDKEINAAFDEIKEKGNSAKADRCVEAAKEKLDNLKDTLPKEVENCIESQQEEEINDLFDKLIDEISNGKKIESLIESLEKEVSTGRGEDIEKKIPGVRVSLDQYESIIDDLMDNGGKIMEQLESQTKECSNKQLVDVHSSVVTIKENAFKCISRA